MANIKISELNALTEKADNDLLAIVDTSADETKKIQVSDLVNKNIELIAVSDTAPSECSIGDKYYNTTDKEIYTATGTNTWSETGTTPISGILYILTTDQRLYNYDGTDLVMVGGAGSIVHNNYSESTTEPYSANYVNNLHTYSTDEVRVGTWIDGKPLYRKVLQNSYSTTGTGSFTVYLTINESVDTLTGFDSYFKGQGKNFVVKVGMSSISNATYGSTIWYSINNKTFSVKIDGKGNNDVIIVYVIAYYTKTTD